MLGRIRFRTLALPALAIALAVLVLAGAATAGGTQLYAKGVRICKTNVDRYHSTCFAMKRVFVKAGTPGARPFTPMTASPDVVTIGPNGGLTPADIVSAYHLAVSGGTGQTVAIVDAFNDPNIQADLDNFDTVYGLSCSSCLTVHNMGTAPADNDQTGWSVEESLDVEAVHAACPACHILLVEAVSNSNANLDAAENYAASNGATEISNSFGGPEAGAVDSAFDHKGIVITASTGDDGYYNMDQLKTNGTNKPNAPASYPTVIAVGGTSLYLTQNATPTRSYETVWNTNGPQLAYALALGGPLGAGGGGCSTLYNAQGWQSHMAGYSNAVCAGKRLVGDVSMVADPLTGFDIYDSYTCNSGCVSAPKWLTIGGTSLSSPLLAAAWGLAGGAKGIPYPAVTLYSHPSSTRYDVTVGGNGFCDGEGAPQCGNWNQQGFGILDCDYVGITNTVSAGTGACDAAPGFDGPTGVGTPNSMTLFAKPLLAMNAITGPATATHGTSGGPWSITGTDPAPGGTIACTWNWGDGTTNSTPGCSSISHTYASTGQKTITVTTKDQYGIPGAAKTLIVTVS
jgi:PKD domain-containing protein/subtilase family protein